MKCPNNGNRQVIDILMEDSDTEAIRTLMMAGKPMMEIMGHMVDRHAEHFRAFAEEQELNPIVTMGLATAIAAQVSQLYANIEGKLQQEASRN